MHATHLITWFALTCGLAAQEPQSRIDLQSLRGILPERVEIHTGEPDPRNGIPGIHAVGRDYKVSFHTGMTFYPRMGPSHPNQPFSWRTESVRIGVHELVTGEREGGRAAGFRYEYGLGEVVEAYDVLPEGLEQTFVIPVRPWGSGDLVVTGSVETPLVTDAVTCQHGGLEFRLPDGGAVLSYGAAIAVDAAGRTGDMTTSWDGERITLTLDAAWLESAEFPLVVDPLLTPITVRTVATPVLTVPLMDCAFDDSGTSRDHWLAYSMDFAASDGDVYMVRYDPDGLFLPLNRYTDVGPFIDTGDVSMAFVEGSDRVVLAYEIRGVLLGNEDIRWHAHALLDGNLSTAFGVISHPEGVRSPDVGGAHGSSLFDRACIGYVRGSGVIKPTFNREYEQAVFAILDLPPAGFSSGNQGVIASQTVIPFGTPIREMGMPRVIKTVQATGGQTRWAVTWAQEEYGVGPNAENLWQVRCAQVDATGAISAVHEPLGVIAPLSAGPTDPPAWHAAGAEIVSRDGGIMLLVPWRQPATSNGNLSDPGSGSALETFVLDWPAPGNASPILLARNDIESVGNAPAFTMDVRDAVADHVDGIRAGWTYRRNTDLVFATVGHDGAAISKDILTPINIFLDRPGICFDSSREVFRTVFGDPVAPNWVLRQATWTYPVVPPVSVYGPSCSPVIFRFDGSRIIGAGGGEMVVDHPPSIPGPLVHLLYLSLGRAVLPIAPFNLQGLGTSCTINLDPALLYASALGTTSPNVQFRLPVPIPGTTPGINSYWQVLSFDAATGDHHITSGLLVPLVR